MQKQTRGYKRITYIERDIIAQHLALGNSKRAIARKLCRSPSTITREIIRDTKKSDGYGYGAARASRRSVRRASSRRRSKYKLERFVRLHRYVMEKLKQLWSPQQIERRLKDEYPFDKSMRISSESIYRYLYIRPSRELRMLLRHGHLRRRKRGRPRKEEQRGKIPDMTMIEDRPQEVRKRLVPGHWEGDLLKGKRNQSAIGTLVERSTRYVILVPLGGLDASSVRKAFAKAIEGFPKDIRRSLTYDQGKEMADHLQLTMDTDMQVYFAQKGSPWERGTSENTNGLIRQFFPKGTDFTLVNNEELKRAQDLLNDRPRRVLDWQKPDEVLADVLH